MRTWNANWFDIHDLEDEMLKRDPIAIGPSRFLVAKISRERARSLRCVMIDATPGPDGEGIELPPCGEVAVAFVEGEPACGSCVGDAEGQDLKIEWFPEYATRARG